jgi:ankyrin repeat protein
VYCQVDYICGLVPARIRHALADLPKTLDETYKRTLQEINEAEWKIAHRVFQFIAVARRPLGVKELADLLAFDFEAGSIPKFHEGWRLEDPVDAVLPTYSSLLAIVDESYGDEFSTERYLGKVIQFSHFSVREFLTSARLAEASDTISRRYHISMTPAHTLAAQACLGILLHIDKDVVTRDSLEELPLAKYAAKHWVDHAQLEDVSRNVEDGMKQLFDPSNSHLAVCIWIRDPDFRWDRMRRTERPLPPDRTPLHYAAFWGLDSIVEFLVIEHAQDVHSRGFTDEDNATPLHLASKSGHVKVSRFLLEHDADVTAQDKYGMTPLHWASGDGRLEVARMLIECGADVTAHDDRHRTPLHQASGNGQLEVARMLIERCADVTAHDDNHQTPLHWASANGQLEVARMLIERGADVTAHDNSHRTPLHPASEYGKLEVARMLIERGADVTARNKDGETPFHLASKEGEAEVASMLIECGADVTAQTDGGSTPLHLAATRSSWTRWPKRSAKVAHILLEHGADMTVQDKCGRTAFDLASSDRGIAEVAHVLLQHGTDPGTHENVN